MKSLDEDFTLSSSFSTLLYEISRRQWLKMLTHKRRTVRVTIEQENALIEDGFVSALEKSEKYQLFREKFNHLSDGCRQVLRMTFDGYSMKEIAEQCGFASERYARKRKFKCKEKLLQLIRADNRYQELKDHD
jgi:RNA polymerase sigma factor (sigma-70 family)